MIEINYYRVVSRLVDIFGGDPSAWYQRLHMIGLKKSELKHDAGYRSRYWGLMFYWFAVFWNSNWHPDVSYSQLVPAPWSGFSIFWGPNATGEPGVTLWKRKKFFGYRRR